MYGLEFNDTALRRALKYLRDLVVCMHMSIDWYYPSLENPEDGCYLEIRDWKTAQKRMHLVSGGCTDFQLV